jgi:hypothetical protein
MNNTKCEYRVSQVDDDVEAVNETMGKWAEAGWELVSGSVNSWASRGSNYNDMTIWHTRYVMYWRKPITNIPEPTSV